MIRTTACLVGVLLASSMTLAYEVGTHAKITEQAFERSTLKSGKLAQFGLYDLNGLFGTTFNEFAPNAETRERRQYNFEHKVILDSIFARIATDQRYQSFPYRPVGWLTVGAIREDDGSLVDFPASIKVKTTYAEIYGLENVLEIIENDLPIGGQHFNRFCNHFYDPTKGARPGGLDEALYSDYPSCPKEGLSTGVLGSQTQSGIAAPAWALALRTNTSFFDAVAELQGRANHFAISDAKEAMWRAATGYDGAMQSIVAPTGGARMKYWATTFRTLGSVIHLLQDMGNAQHTRNEGHAFGVRHTYEQYVENRTSNATNRVIFDAQGGFKEEKPDLNNPSPWTDYLWSSYPIPPRFTKYEHYWHSSSGQGLAAYTNAGFLTPGRNIGNTKYALPPSDARDSRYTQVTTQEYVDGQLLDVQRLHYPVPDAAQGGATETIPMTRSSTIGWAQNYFNLPDSTLRAATYGPDSTVYDAQAGLQLPRAVAYSAGLIDHFFRGQLKIDAPENGIFAYSDTSKDEVNDPRYSTVGFKRIKFKVTNTTEAITPPGASAVDQNIANAKLVAAVKYVANRCAPSNNDLTGEWGAPSRDYSTCREGVTGGVINKVDILGAEKLAVSRACKINGVSALSNVAIAAQQQIEVECDFIEEPIPYSGTDMKLVVAIRGDLGEEKDAVIVQVEDIAEPSWLNYQNHTDHVVIDDKVFPWNQVPTQYTGMRMPACSASAPNTVVTFGDGSTPGSVKGCARYPVYGMVYPNALSNTPPVARFKLAPTEFAQMAFLAPAKYRYHEHAPYVSNTCGLKAYGSAGASGTITAPYYPEIPLSWTEAQKEALMFENAKKMYVYSATLFPSKNQVDYTVSDPATFTFDVAREPVAVFRGRGQHTFDDPVTANELVRPVGCIAPLYYEPTVAQRPQYANRPGFTGFVYLHPTDTKAMHDALPNTKVGVQKSVTFCANEDCTQ